MSRGTSMPARDREIAALELAGFRVECADGRIGTVEGVTRPDGSSDVSVVIRTGLFVNRTTIVPLADVVTVLPDARRLVVRTPVA